MASLEVHISDLIEVKDQGLVGSFTGSLGLARVDLTDRDDVAVAEEGRQ